MALSAFSLTPPPTPHFISSWLCMYPQKLLNYWFNLSSVTPKHFVIWPCCHIHTPCCLWCHLTFVFNSLGLVGLFLDVTPNVFLSWLSWFLETTRFLSKFWACKTWQFICKYLGFSFYPYFLALFCDSSSLTLSLLWKISSISSSSLFSS